MLITSIVVERNHLYMGCQSGYLCDCFSQAIHSGRTERTGRAGGTVQIAIKDDVAGVDGGFSIAVIIVTVGIYPVSKGIAGSRMNIVI